MTHPFRTRRFLMFAASTAVAAGGALLPTGAFAAAPATPHTAVADHRIAADDDHGDSDARVNPIGKGDHPIIVKPGGKAGHGKGGVKGDGVKAPTDGTINCIAAGPPCGPPIGNPAPVGTDGTVSPGDGTVNCIMAGPPCGPPVDTAHSVD